MPLPAPKGMPKELKTIGDHIRAWRITNGLFQKDVASILGITEESLVRWERGTTPYMRYMPGIINMIGYVPLPIDTSTLGGKVWYCRCLLGETSREFGRRIPVDASTIRYWEIKKSVPLTHAQKVEEICTEIIDLYLKTQERRLSNSNSENVITTLNKISKKDSVLENDISKIS